MHQQSCEWVAGIRQHYPELSHSVLAPHFTFVFPTRAASEDDLVAHVAACADGFKRIDFVLRSSLLVKDDSSDNYYVMLVPDEGFSGIVRLHDKLYTGVLATSLRLNIPFIPHITVGYSTDVQFCKRVVDALNAAEFEIEGTIAALDIVRKDGTAAETIKRLYLQ
ncbi:MAG: 2'-5' RNA ligase family protein [Chloroflexota bacterium]|nr:2'-5' RNA ligase family protein [Chloroflexota bacterium]MDQ5864483.1 2'-5' RNA ligase family protein [Chloroflexota bacterium]